MLSVTLITALLAAGSSLGVPHSRSSALARDVTHVALDEVSREYVAFRRDGSLVGRFPVTDSLLPFKRAASECGDLSVDDAKKIPGWSKIEQYANDNWGDHKRNVVTNPPEYLDSPAQFCITSEVVKLSFDEDPVCQNHTSHTDGKLVGTSGEVDIEGDSGFNTGTSYTVSQAASIGVSSTLKVSVGIPDVESVSSELTVSTEITNTLSKTFDVSYNDVHKVTLKVQAPEGKTCDAVLSVNSCHRQATGNVRYLATGWVWFNYEDKQKDHYKWAASIDAILTNQDDRSSFAEFRGSMLSDTHAAYDGSCK